MSGAIKSIGWGVQAPAMQAEGIVEKKSTAGFDTWKILDYCPLVSLVSGIYKLVLVDQMIKSGYAKDHKWDTTLMVMRGVLSTLQLGIVMLFIDAVTTKARANQRQAEINQQLWDDIGIDTKFGQAREATPVFADYEDNLSNDRSFMEQFNPSTTSIPSTTFTAADFYRAALAATRPQQ